MIKDGKLYCDYCGNVIFRRTRKRDFESNKTHFCCKKCEGKFRKGKLNRPKKYNKIILEKEYAIIKINNNIKGELDCLIDIEDVEKVKNYYWNIRYDKRHPNCTSYVETRVLNGGKYKRVHIHRFLVNPPKDKVVDHINGNGLDNRKFNLKICSQNLNTKNRPFAKNIYFNKRDNLYYTKFSINGKAKYLCYTRDLAEAEKYAKLGKKLISENRIDELLNMKCKCILHSHNN